MDELQLEKDGLHAAVASNEVQLQQQNTEIQQLHDKVTMSTTYYIVSNHSAGGLLVVLCSAEQCGIRTVLVLY